MQKVRIATKSKNLLQPNDKVMVAVSGGAASLGLLYAFMQLQNTNPGRLERGKVQFELSAVFVDESAAATGAAAEQRWMQLQTAMRAIEFKGQCHRVLLEDVYDANDALHACDGVSTDMHGMPSVTETEPPASHSQQLLQGHTGGQPADVALNTQSTSNSSCSHHASGSSASSSQRLQTLLGSIQDVTGREDCVHYLRQQLLLRTAARHGCSKLALGLCASTIVFRVIADAAKGRGFSLPADIQLVDARGVGQGLPAVLHPLREVSKKELTALCNFKGMLTNDVVESSGVQGEASGSKGSVNALAAGFINAMQSNLPASIYTILRTASHLESFDFNDAAAVCGDAQSKSVTVSDGPVAEGTGAVGAVAGSSSAGCFTQTRMWCRVCRAPLPNAPGNEEDRGITDSKKGLADEVASGSNQVPAANGGIDSDLNHGGQHHDQIRLCYSCDRQILDKLDVPDASFEGGQSAKAKLLNSLLPP